MATPCKLFYYNKIYSILWIGSYTMSPLPFNPVLYFLEHYKITNESEIPVIKFNYISYLVFKENQPSHSYKTYYQTATYVK